MSLSLRLMLVSLVALLAAACERIPVPSGNVAAPTEPPAYTMEHPKSGQIGQAAKR